MVNREEPEKKSMEDWIMFPVVYLFGLGCQESRSELGYNFPLPPPPQKKK